MWWYLSRNKMLAHRFYHVLEPSTIANLVNHFFNFFLARIVYRRVLAWLLKTIMKKFLNVYSTCIVRPSTKVFNLGAASLSRFVKIKFQNLIFLFYDIVSFFCIGFLSNGVEKHVLASSTRNAIVPAEVLVPEGSGP